MIAASPPALGRDDNRSWAQRYERLRRIGLQLGAQFLDDTEGLSKFLREGTASWMLSPAEQSRRKPPNLAPHAHVALAHGDRSDVTRLLATMVGAAATEAGR
jgi:hypothetical protein